MTDDISKVDECLRSLPDLWGRTADACVEPAAAHAIRCCANELQLRIAAVESAAAPAEVDEDWQLIDGHRSPDGMTYTATYWCASTGALKTETTSDGRFRAGEGPRIRRPALARQLAEAKERMRELEAQRDDYLNREWAAEKAKRKAESQLAEATRRLGEVEGLLREASSRVRHNSDCNQITNGIDGDCDCGQILLTERIDAALTKEPAK